jgi:hypothetical protein
MNCTLKDSLTEPPSVAPLTQLMPGLAISWSVLHIHLFCFLYHKLIRCLAYMVSIWLFSLSLSIEKICKIVPPGHRPVGPHEERRSTICRQVVSSWKGPPPICCGVQLTISYILTDCRQHLNHRLQYFPSQNLTQFYPMMNICFPIYLPTLTLLNR